MKQNAQHEGELKGRSKWGISKNNLLLSIIEYNDSSDFTHIIQTAKTKWAIRNVLDFTQNPAPFILVILPDKIEIDNLNYHLVFNLVNLLFVSTFMFVSCPVVC